jgi:hypothetical protein
LYVAVTTTLRVAVANRLRSDGDAGSPHPNASLANVDYLLARGAGASSSSARFVLLEEPPSALLAHMENDASPFHKPKNTAFVLHCR